jgi:hypothetical protein
MNLGSAQTKPVYQYFINATTQVISMIYQIKIPVYTPQLTSGKHFRARVEWPTVSLAELDGRTIEAKTQNIYWRRS